MLVYRLSSLRYAKDLSGEGARLHGGRWNNIGVPVIYTSGSRSLSLLEFSVNINNERILSGLCMIVMEVSGKLQEIEVDKLPADWRLNPAPASTKDFGSLLLKQLSCPVIKIPSVVIPEEYNYLVNPLHPMISNCKVIAVEDFLFDARIKT